MFPSEPSVVNSKTGTYFRTIVTFCHFLMSFAKASFIFIKFNYGAFIW